MGIWECVGLHIGLFADYTDIIFGAVCRFLKKQLFVSKSSIFNKPNHLAR